MFALRAFGTILSLYFAHPDADACPQVFGGSMLHAQNSERRRSLLYSVESSARSIFIVHSGAWKDPRPLAVAGIRLLETRSAARTPNAVVELEADLFGCKRGRYAVQRDDAIGAGAYVLAVLDGALLIEYLGELRFIHVDGVDPGPFSRAWRSRWPMNPYLSRGAAQSPMVAKRR
jgi:hypothetical protein